MQAQRQAHAAEANVRPMNMSARRRKQITAFSVAAACLILGSAVYVLFRPTTLLMFHWADALRLTHSVRLMRASTCGLPERGEYAPIDT